MRKSAIILALLLICVCLPAQEKVYPYYWLNMGITEDLSTSAVVSWRSPVEYPVGRAQIAPMVMTPNIADQARDVEVLSGLDREFVQDEKRSYPEEYYHRAFFTGLQPGTSYLYRVGDGKLWSEWCEFKTAESGDKPFKFIFFGDVQAGMMDVYPRIARKACSMAPDAAFVTFVGDLVGDRRHQNYTNFFNGNGWMLKQMPVAAVADGHEHHFTDNVMEIVHLWKNMFAYPKNAPDEAWEHGNYYFDCQGCRFIAVDSHYMLQDTEGVKDAMVWLEDCLRDNPCTWTVVAMHRPLYSTAYGRAEVNHMLDAFKELYVKYGVDVILSAHDHQYSRFTEKKGRKSCPPVSVVSQAGGKCYIPLYNSHADRIGTALQNFQLVSISPERLLFETYQADGTLYDCFSIENAGGKKKFVDRTPAVEEKIDVEYRIVYDNHAMTPEKEQNTLQRMEKYLTNKKH